MLYKHFENICKLRVEDCICQMLQRWNNGKLLEYRYFTEGRINLILQVKYLVNQEINKVILRICMNCSGMLRQSEGQEIYINSLIASHNIEFFPKILFYDDTKSIIPYAYMFMEYIDGDILDNKHDKKVFYNVGQSLARLHNIDVVSYGKKPLEHTSLSGHTYYFNCFKTAIQLCSDINIDMADSFRELLNKYYNKYLYKDKSPKLLHHDFHGRNVIIKPNNEIKIIDWDSSRGGVSEYDLIKFKYLNISDYKSDQINGFVEGYLSERNINIDVNFCLYEICWLMRMVVFETLYQTEDQYYPDVSFYIKKYWAYYNEFARIQESVVSDWENFFVENVRSSE